LVIKGGGASDQVPPAAESASRPGDVVVQYRPKHHAHDAKHDKVESAMTDPIADMLTRIRNAVTAKHTRVDMPASRLKTEIARILVDEGYVLGFKVLEEPGAAAEAAKTLRVLLKYGPHGESLITGIERISRPGRRVYFGRNDVPQVLAGLGTSILTTSHGVMTGRQAVKAGVGGEVLCNIW
jgi:small subunit ribosomal protein S8